MNKIDNDVDPNKSLEVFVPMTFSSQDEIRFNLQVL